MRAKPTGKQTLTSRLENRDTRPGPQVRSGPREVLRRFGQMVIRGRDEEQIHGLRALESVARHEHPPECRDPTIVGRATEIIKGALARVERVYHAVWFDRSGEAEGEVTGAWTEVAHDHAGPEIEGRDHGVWVAQAILACSAGEQPSADPSRQAIEAHCTRA